MANEFHPSYSSLILVYRDTITQSYTHSDILKLVRCIFSYDSTVGLAMLMELPVHYKTI